jgi:hypothetical protein
VWFPLDMLGSRPDDHNTAVGRRDSDGLRLHGIAMCG